MVKTLNRNNYLDFFGDPRLEFDVKRLECEAAQGTL